MKTFYSDKTMTIYQGDMLRVLPTLSVDVVITDAPFGIKDRAMVDLPGRRGGNNTYHGESEWDESINGEWCRIACECAPVVFWFGHWRKRSEVESAMPHPLRCEIIWAKDCHVGPPCPAAMRDERIWLFSRDGFKANHFETTVWDEPIIPTWNHKRHKNEKPLALMKRLVRFATKETDVICDPFMGSGTTLHAAAQLGRSCVGIDIDPTCCEAARNRLRGVEPQRSASQVVLPFTS